MLCLVSGCELKSQAAGPQAFATVCLAKPRSAFQEVSETQVQQKWLSAHPTFSLPASCPWVHMRHSLPAGRSASRRDFSIPLAACSRHSDGLKHAEHQHTCPVKVWVVFDWCVVCTAINRGSIGHALPLLAAMGALPGWERTVHCNFAGCAVRNDCSLPCQTAIGSAWCWSMAARHQNTP